MTITAKHTTYLGKLDGELTPFTRGLLNVARGNTRRDDTIAAIKAALQDRSGRRWSVTGGNGTAWGWLRIHALPRDRVSEYGGKGYSTGYLSATDARWLADLLGLEAPVHFQGESIASGRDYYLEYLDRAEGIPPTVTGRPYWD